MLRVTLIGSIVLGLFVIGCEKEESKPTTKPSKTPPAATMPSGSIMKDMATSANAVASDVQAQAKKLIDQATQYIKENKLDAADTVLTKLEGMKAQLPESMQQQITSLRDNFNKLKAAGNLLPSGGGAKMPTTLPGGM